MNKYFKRILILIALLITLISLTIYFQFTRDNRLELNVEILNETKVEYLNLLPQLDNEPKAYFFCSSNSNDCHYTFTEILVPLVKNANVYRFDNIYYVDITEIDENILPSALKNHLGFSRYPAFVMLWQENGQIKYKSVLEWSDEAAFTANLIRSWMIENQLWLDEYVN